MYKMPEMSLEAIQGRIQTWNQQLMVLQRAVAKAEQSPENLQVQVTNLQSNFRGQLLSLPLETLPAEQAGTWQAALTEINRHLRLLGQEVVFWQAAKQPETQQQRRQQLEARLSQLQGFGQVLLDA
jgi:chromosome segregation ATPase